MNINSIKSLFFLTIIILVNNSNLFSQYKAGIISTLQSTYSDKNNLKNINVDKHYRLIKKYQRKKILKSI
jgi:hypothetical protein